MKEFSVCTLQPFKTLTIISCFLFSHTAAVFQFGHSETVVQVFTALGLFKDQERLLATNMVKMRNRNFRTSKISPYSANIVFVLYACEDLRHVHDTDDRNITTYVLKILVNEEPVTIPACNKKQCLYSVVKKYYEDLIDHCDHDALCGSDYDHHDDHDHDDHDHDNDDGKRNNSAKMTWSFYFVFINIVLFLL